MWAETTTAATTTTTSSNYVEIYLPAPRRPEYYAPSWPIAPVHDPALCTAKPAGSSPRQEVDRALLRLGQPPPGRSARSRPG